MRYQTLESAYRYLPALNLWAIPASYPQKLSLVKWKPYQNAAPDKTTVDRWLRRWPYAAAAIPTGGQTVIVVDADSIEAVRELNRRGLPRTWATSTNRGTHYFFQPPQNVKAKERNVYETNGDYCNSTRDSIGHSDREELEHSKYAGMRSTRCGHGNRDAITLCPATRGYEGAEAGDIRNSAGEIGPHIDVRGQGGFAILYPWIRGYSPDDVELAPLPDWLLAHFRAKAERRVARPSAPARPFTGVISPYARRAFDGAINSLIDAQPGTRNDKASRVACYLGALCGVGELAPDSTLRALYSIANLWPNSEKTRDTIGRAFEVGCNNPQIPSHSY